MRTFKCSGNDYKYICGTPANQVFHYQTFHKIKLGKCLCGHKSINGICTDINCPFEKSTGDNINSNESNSFGDPCSSNFVDPIINPIIDQRSGNIVDPNIDPNIYPNVDPNIVPNIDPNVDPIIAPTTDPIIDPITDPIIDPITDPGGLTSLEQVATVTFSQPGHINNKERIHKL